MSFSSVGFFAFLLVGIIVYYVLPKNIQWVWLLILSYLYYFTFSVKASLFMVFATVTIYAGGIWLESIQKKADAYLAVNKAVITKDEKKAYKEKIKKNKRWVLLLIILLDFGMLAIVKYTDFAIENINVLLGKFGAEPFGLMNLGLPLGISFFTFQSVSYIIDVYQGKYECEKNIFKMGLFVSFFPQLLQGPIGRYDRLGKQLYEGHSFNLKHVEFGLQRIGWGLFKKLVIADRAAVLVLNVFTNYEMYNGFHYILAVLMYSVDLYMDFSGGIDIVIGAAQMFGITMDENFRQPYFSKSIGEFWRRWHITLGTWMKDYIFYPMSLSKKMNRFGKWAKKHMGNTIGRTLPICFANIVIFFIVGIWHGAAWKFIAYGLYNGFIIAISNLLEPVYKKLLNKFHINAASKGWTVWQIIRTFILVNIGWYFDMAESMRQALQMMKWSVVGICASQFKSEAILSLGIEARDYVIIIAGCIIVFIVSVLKEKGIAIRESIASKPLVIRWAFYYALVVVILIFGYIGATQGFIYANF
jgi:alginate O-acetyltransferase complex protein AlgI